MAQLGQKPHGFKDLDFLMVLRKAAVPPGDTPRVSHPMQLRTPFQKFIDVSRNRSGPRGCPGRGPDQSPER